MTTSTRLFLGLLLGLLAVAVVRGSYEDLSPLKDQQEHHLYPFRAYKTDHFAQEGPLPPVPVPNTVTDVDTNEQKVCGHGVSGKSGKKRQSTCSWGFNQTLPCENPEIRARYAAALTPDRFGYEVPRPVVRYNVVVLSADDGSDATASDLQIQQQHAILVDAYSPARVSFTYTVQRFQQSILRYRTILGGPCSRQDVKDANVSLGCLSPLTGWDGGSVMCKSATCDPTCSTYDEVVNRPTECPCVCVPEYFNCVPQMIANRYCNPECNFAQWNWDGGDCCPNATDVTNSDIFKNMTCRDPDHVLRNWMDSYDLYFFLNLDSTSTINVVLIPGDDGDHLGYATSPNDPAYFTREGGIILNTNRKAYGVYLSDGFTGVTLVHMMGHVLGLLHTHAGVTDLLYPPYTKSDVCRDACYEEQPLLSQRGSDTTGDLINDTRPTPANTRCRDPLACSPKGEPVFCTDCQTQPWLSTPYNNYMGFATDSCPKDFTPQQLGRMYCYVDLFLRRKYLSSGDASPGPILYAPMLSDSRGSIKVDWSGSFPFETGTTDSPSTFTWYLERNPPLENTIQVVGTTFYLDRKITARVPYRWRVRLVIKGQLSAWSPWSEPLALARVCNCRPWDLNAVKEIDAIRSKGLCNA
eukprot:TRINITY_DN659_c0_g1_i4.p1 TRINITY_DN659_c0_g1~~TRINITY_DN659_c0_g1_i4.p1  ORF type:complete len:659 (-),score=178.30 TRINITY_DN659_c0_g1_i4:117-2027(-)